MLGIPSRYSKWATGVDLEILQPMARITRTTVRTTMRLSKKSDGNHTIHIWGRIDALHILNGAVGTLLSGLFVNGEFIDNFAP